MVTVLLGCLNRGRSSLLNPRKKPLDEILNNKNMKSLQPPLPADLAISFYIQAHKLTFAVYHVHNKANRKDFEVYHTLSSGFLGTSDSDFRLYLPYTSLYLLAS
ncbi:ROGDI [Cordylochernes scorpioides]|uniref:ROGDI n=1 Tax=Cordylochernes scorpioides TaxID=51811 RepID=A0ABY6L1X9_9ARAC|nr:ROGDI [Cordylochernes scorpioides]